jgi:hypothetical protein
MENAILNEAVNATLEADAYEAKLDSLATEFVNVTEKINAHMHECESPDYLSELFGNRSTFSNPNVFAQFLMEHLLDPLETDPATFDAESKIWWAKVSMHMGPDYIAKLRKVVAWMEKFDTFR